MSCENCAVRSHGRRKSLCQGRKRVALAQRLLNKVAVITGGGRGIGRAIAEHFLNEGARVAIFSRSEDDLASVAAASPARVHRVVGDVTRLEDLQQLVESTIRRFGRVDILVANAGSVAFVDISACAGALVTEQFTEQFGVNFLGALQSVQCFLPVLSPGASVLFVTAALAPQDSPGLAIFNASKAAVRSLACSLDVELRDRQIRVNCLAPGPTDTTFWPTEVESSELPKSGQAVSPAVDIPRGDAAEVAEAAVFLVSDAARSIRGQEIIVNESSP